MAWLVTAAIALLASPRVSADRIDKATAAYQHHDAAATIAALAAAATTMMPRPVATMAAHAVRLPFGAPP